MRLTRAAQRAQENVEEPITDATEVKARTPLNEISPNASPELIEPVEEVTKKTPARSKSKKGGKKAKKGKKGKAAEEEEEEPVQVVLEDERQAAGSPASDAAAEELTKDNSDGKGIDVPNRNNVTDGATSDTAQVPVNDERPASPPSKAVRLTRRQLAKQEEELKQSQRAASPAQDVEPESAPEVVEEPSTEARNVQIEAVLEAEGVQLDSVGEEPREETPLLEATEADYVPEETSSGAQEEVPEAPEERTAAPEDQLQDQVSEKEHDVPQVSETVEVEAEVVAPSVDITSEPEPKMLAAERPSEAPSSPAMSRTPSRRASRSPSKSPMRIEASIEALDALEEALENVGKAVSHFDQSNDEKSPRKKAFPKDAATPNTRSKTPRKTPIATRVSRTPGAAPKSMKPMTSSLARASSVRNALPKDAKDVRKGSTDTVDYLASKRRPVSVSFPTPPPPPKGRAPTKATFQLSSEATAAKLKAQKEERLKREAEREAEGVKPKPRPISMPPIAKSTKPPTKASFELPGEAIAAKLKAQKEERQKREAENAPSQQPKARPVSISMPPPTVKSTKPPTKANFQLPGEAIAAKLKAQREERQKREEEAVAAKKAAAAAATKLRSAAVRKLMTLPTRSQPGVTIPPPPKTEPQPTAPPRSTSLASKRSSIQLSRSTSVSTNASKRNSIVTPVDAVQQKLKGKEVFNRDKTEKEAKERDRKEKEEAAKQARAQAAERGRIASREWAEKQRRKMMEAVRAKAEAA
ncbi:hypothetical protein EK21DRAFT_84464 [Setomelanomma holmii]|uniref:Carboxylesterase family protein n=1 Tax=Setomelanomma holmii TaxID=210430 RepID=A0A9P4HIW4_9PLEO|nr:hypothetical protein EK21DRAFT_84464 [Setomelanomma holmii]